MKIEHRNTKSRGSLVVLGSLLCFVMTFCGCSDKEAQDKVLRRRANLSGVARMYMDYHKAEGRAPANAIELTSQMREDNGDDAAAGEAAMEGDVTIIYDADLKNEDAVRGLVLAFEAAVPRTGGYVVTADGTVSLMKASEFARTEAMPVLEKQ